MTAESDNRSRERLTAARRLLEQERLDVLLVTATPDVRYLSGFRGDESALLIADDWALIAADVRYWAQVHEEVSAFELLKVDETDNSLDRHGLFEDALLAVRERTGSDVNLGFQGGDVSYGGYRRLRRRHQGHLRDVGEHVAALRLVKAADEIAAVRRACAIADAALERVVAVGLVGRSELDVAWQILAEMHALGSEGPSFETITGTGERAALAHAIPSERRIAAGELVVIDTGARVDGYCSDITRTFAAGSVSAEQRAVYGIVLRAQLAGLAAVGDGVNGRSVDGAARAVIDAAGYGDSFGHGVGHGVGLEIHEGPRLDRRRGDPLASGMVVTVEPGIYLEGRLGVRIEDTVLVTPVGGEPLTAFSKELLVTD